MVINISRYSRRYMSTLFVQTFSRKVKACCEFLEPQYARLQKWLEGLDLHYLYKVTLTSKYSVTNNDKFELNVKAFLGQLDSSKVDYIMFPAIQPKNHKLHYHGFFYMKERFVMFGVSLTGEAYLASMHEYVIHHLGSQFKFDNVVRTCKEKNFNGPEVIKSILDYIFSEKNYLGAMTQWDVLHSPLEIFR